MKAIPSTAGDDSHEESDVDLSSSIKTKPGPEGDTATSEPEGLSHLDLDSGNRVSSSS